MSLLLRIAGLVLGTCLLIGGLASLVLGLLALAEHPQKGFQVTVFSLVTGGVGAWMLWETWRAWRRDSQSQPQSQSQSQSQPRTPGADAQA